MRAFVESHLVVLVVVVLGGVADAALFLVKVVGA